MLKVVLNSPQGDEVALARLGPHETLGELAVLVARSLIKVDGRAIVLHDLPELRRQAGFDPGVHDGDERARA